MDEQLNELFLKISLLGIAIMGSLGLYFAWKDNKRKKSQKPLVKTFKNHGTE